MTREAPAARRSAAAAAERSGVEIRELTEVAELTEVQGLFDAIWRSAPGRSALSVDLMRAFALAGLYLAGAYDGAELIGACVGFAATPEHRSLHSHIAGVTAGAAGRHVGYALKLHQRAWALERGFTEIAWTFDPLVRRNAYFNLTKLGATSRAYRPDCYGPMSDGINRDDASDRLYVAWDLGSDAVRARCGDAGTAPEEPANPGSAGEAPALLSSGDDERPERFDVPHAAHVVVDVPPDVERLRRIRPSVAHEWRLALREALTSELSAGATIVGFARDRGYLIERGEGR